MKQRAYNTFVFFFQRACGIQCRLAMISEDFGQRVDLGQRIRDVLESYPEGPAILFELVQNAEDAGASTVSIVLDHRQHEGQRLVFPGSREVSKQESE